jgi:heme/copper-type cytochrome/quinol oxidase subunit 2
MIRCRSFRPNFVVVCLAVGLVLLASSVATACPTCKDGLANDPASANLARGIYYSILFMVTVPYVVFGSLAAYFYWQIRKAKARQKAVAPDLVVQPH